METSVNTLIDDLLWPTTEVTRVLAAVAKGDLLQNVRLDVDGRPLEGEFGLDTAGPPSVRLPMIPRTTAPRAGSTHGYARNWEYQNATEQGRRHRPERICGSRAADGRREAPERRR